MVNKIGSVGFGDKKDNGVLPHAEIYLEGSPYKKPIVGSIHLSPRVVVINNSYSLNNFTRLLRPVIDGLPWKDENPRLKPNKICVLSAGDSPGERFFLQYDIEEDKAIREDSEGVHTNVGTKEIKDIINKSIDYYKRKGDTKNVILLNKILSVVK